MTSKLFNAQNALSQLVRLEAVSGLKCGLNNSNLDAAILLKHASK